MSIKMLPTGNMNLEEKLFNNQIWKAEDVASYLQCSVGHVYNLVNQKRIPYRKLGRLLRFFCYEIVEWAQRGELL